nr:3-hydroxyacyl-CoA dehydrogenase NAD-binding domain-containing protein [Candidatus Njordarchaeum guaymaensis]
MRIEDVKKIVVLGSGIMGSGISEAAAKAGYRVAMTDVSEELVKHGLESIKASLNRIINRGKITKADADAALSRIKGTTDMREAARDAQVVIEAITEDISLKKKVFKELDEICPKETVIASNTSAIMITDLASATKRGDRFIGMHFFSPAQIMKLVEIIRGAETSDETFQLIRDLSVKFNKVPIAVNDSPGFFTTRYITACAAEAVRLFESGIAGIKDIDTMCKLAFNFPAGPIELADFVGLDTMLHVLEYLHAETGDAHYAPPLIVKKLVKSGFKGFKPGSKGGFYEYFRIKREPMLK